MSLLPRVCPVLWSSLILLLLAVVPSSAQPFQSAELEWLPPTFEARSEPAPLALSAASGLEPLGRLAEVRQGAGDRLQALQAWNESGRRPLQDGVVRPLALRREIRLDASLLATPVGEKAGGVFARSTSETVAWGAEVWVEGAFLLRLRLDAVDLPAGTRLWVHGEDGRQIGPFGLELVDDDGGLWTPSVPGSVLRLEVELPDGQLVGERVWGFDVGRVLETVEIDQDGRPKVFDTADTATKADASCLWSAMCIDERRFPAIRAARAAVGHMRYVRGDRGLVCSGGLLADDVPETFVPYFLTAHHCLSTPAEAASLEVYWDVHGSRCGEQPPGWSTYPRSNGATVVATGRATDFTLLRLTRVPSGPGGRTYLGWTTEPMPLGMPLHRLSHPVANSVIYAQIYTPMITTAPRFRCGRVAGRSFDDPASYVRSRNLASATFGGSSGSPVMLDDGTVVGQLYGSCGSLSDERCEIDRYEAMDGAFRTTFPAIERFLVYRETLDPDWTDPDPPPSDDWLTTDELPGFRVQVRIVAGGSPITGVQESGCIGETLCVSGALPGRIEAFVRVVGPRPNGYLWPTLIKFTTSEVEVWIQQLSTGTGRYYRLPAADSGGSTLDGLYDREGFRP